MNPSMESNCKGCCDTWVDSIRKLRDNCSSLRNALNQHQSKRLDVKTEFEVAKEDLGQDVLNELKDWMGKEVLIVWYRWHWKNGISSFKIDLFCFQLEKGF
ncbi:hypothetical protein QN277_013726 [Acacia crassicarpa]|uniref:Uncharacterized protein n=1 Tax=Acacia crassicarpa TaxID=499986 RepID=A0AAE1N3Z5_9FABA|nr:hypothetical protein QN277_013726 [Acacia crassicarpa]